MNWKVLYQTFYIIGVIVMLYLGFSGSPKYLIPCMALLLVDYFIFRPLITKGEL